MGKWKNSREYGEKALVAAEEATDKLWQLNALVLIAQSLVKNGEFKLAMESYEKAKLVGLLYISRANKRFPLYSFLLQFIHAFV